MAIPRRATAAADSQKLTASRTCEKRRLEKLDASLPNTGNTLDLLGNSYLLQKGYRAAYSRLTSG
jgi:hypothetical protein